MWGCGYHTSKKGLRGHKYAKWRLLDFPSPLLPVLYPLHKSQENFSGESDWPKWKQWKVPIWGFPVYSEVNLKVNKPLCPLISLRKSPNLNHEPTIQMYQTSSRTTEIEDREQNTNLWKVGTWKKPAFHKNHLCFPVTVQSELPNLSPVLRSFLPIRLLLTSSIFLPSSWCSFIICLHFTLHLSLTSLIPTLFFLSPDFLFVFLSFLVFF